MKQDRNIFHIRIIPFELTRLRRLSADGVEKMDVNPAILGLQGQIPFNYVTPCIPFFHPIALKI